MEMARLLRSNTMPDGLLFAFADKGDGGDIFVESVNDSSLNRSSLNHGSFRRLEFCAVIVLVLTLCMAILFASATVAYAVKRSVSDASHPAASANSAAEQTTSNHSDLKTFHGMLTDSVCKGRHSRNSNRTSTECARYCIHRGAGYALVNSEGIYTLEGNRSALNKLIGQRVTVTGMLNDHSIGIQSVNAGD